MICLLLPSGGQFYWSSLRPLDDGANFIMYYGIDLQSSSQTLSESYSDSYNNYSSFKLPNAGDEYRSGDYEIIVIDAQLVDWSNITNNNYRG